MCWNPSGVVAGREFDLFLHRLSIEIVPVDAAQVEVARAGWRKYGKGRHPAGLNSLIVCLCFVKDFW